MQSPQRRCLHGNPRVQFISHPPHPNQRVVGDFSGVLRRKIETYPRVRSVFVPKLFRAFEMCGGAVGPYIRGIRHGQPDGSAHAGCGRYPSCFFREQVHVGETGDPSPQHFGNSELRSLAHEIRAYTPLLYRAHCVSQPPPPRPPNRQSAKQRRGRTRMGVNKTWHQRMIATNDVLASLETLTHMRYRAQSYDFS